MKCGDEELSLYVSLEVKEGYCDLMGGGEASQYTGKREFYTRSGGNPWNDIKQRRKELSRTPL